MGNLPKSTGVRTKVDRFAQNLRKAFSKKNSISELDTDTLNAFPARAPDKKKAKSAAVTTKSDFQYVPLPGSGVTRLFVLKSSQDINAPIEGEMDVTLVGLPFDKYTALSYSWAKEDGDDSPTHEITIDGASKRVGQNLFEALCQLRGRTEDQWFWIDALCINQEDVAERNSQIQVMKEIYMYADEVIAWLGVSEVPGYDDAFAWMLECSISSRHVGKHNDEDHTWVDKTGKVMQLCPLLSEHHTGNPQTGSEGLTRDDIENITQVIFAFLNRRYFRRRWVVQELLHSHGRAIMCWGRHRLPWPDLSDQLSELCYNLASKYGELNRLIFKILRDNIGKDGTHMLNIWWGGSLLDFLAKCDQLNCSDPRDRLYSLLAFDSGDNRFGIVADYAKTAREVYVEFAKMMIEKGYQDYLFYNREYKYTEDGLDLPSWVFDLRSHMHTPPPHMLDIKYRIPISLGSDDVLSYSPYYFGTVHSGGGNIRQFFTLMRVEQPQPQTSDDGQEQDSGFGCPPSFDSMLAMIEKSDRQATSQQSEETGLPQMLAPSSENHAAASDQDQKGPVTLYDFASEGPMFASIRPGDLICGSTPDLRSHGTTVHILKKKEGREEDVYWLFRAWPVQENIETDRFLSRDLRSTGRITVRLA